MASRRRRRVPNPLRFRDFVKFAVNFVRPARSQILNQTRPNRYPENGAKILDRVVNALFIATFDDDKIMDAAFGTQELQFSPEFRKQRNNPPILAAAFRLRRPNDKTLGGPIDVFPTRFERFAESQTADSIERQQNAKLCVVATVD